MLNAVNFRERALSEKALDLVNAEKRFSFNEKCQGRTPITRPARCLQRLPRCCDVLHHSIPK